MWETFQGQAMAPPVTLAAMQPPNPNSAVPVLLESFQPISKTFLHEYMHLVGRGEGESFSTAVYSF